jgi:integrase
MRYPHIIKNRYGVYCFRLLTPAYLQRAGAPKEIRFSLHTKNTANAAESFPFVLISAKSLLLELGQLIREHRGTMTERLTAMKSIIEMKRKELRLRELLAEKDDAHWDELKARKRAEWALQAKEQQLQNAVHKVIETNGQLKQSQTQIEQLTTELAFKSPAQLTNQGSDELLSELITKFLIVGAEQEKLKNKTIAARRSNLYRFMDIVGDIPCNHLNADSIRFYRDVIHTIPKNLTKQAIWQTYPSDPADRLSWYQNLHSHGLERLSEGGQDSHFSDTRPFLEWLAKERKHAENFADMLSPIKNDKDYDNSVLPLNPAEMEILVEKHFKPAPKISRNEQTKDWHFWAPLIALTMGLRSEEVGSLTVQQILANFHGKAVIKVDGTKNDSAKRTLPIAQSLLDAGFLDYVELMKDNSASMADGGRLFPDWKSGGGVNNKTYSHTMTKFFCRNKGSKGGPDFGLVVRLDLDREDRRFTFHGLRKTFIHAAYHSGVSLNKIQTIAGHHTDLNETYGLPKGYEDRTDVTFNYILTDSAYASDAEAALSDLKAQIDSVNFGYSLAGLNWQAWRKSKTKKGLKA